jgi:hypothetical protein
MHDKTCFGVTNLLELGELVLLGDIVVLADNHAGEESTKRLQHLSVPFLTIRWRTELTVIPLRSPIPRTEVSTCVAPASRAQ